MSLCVSYALQVIYFFVQLPAHCAVWVLYCVCTTASAFWCVNKPCIVFFCCNYVLLPIVLCLLCVLYIVFIVLYYIVLHNITTNAVYYVSPALHSIMLLCVVLCCIVYSQHRVLVLYCVCTTASKVCRMCKSCVVSALLPVQFAVREYDKFSYQFYFANFLFIFIHFY